MRYRDEKFYWTYQHGVRWPDDYIGPDSMTQWILEKSDGFTDVGLYKISETVRAYAYLILSSQASARSETRRGTTKKDSQKLTTIHKVVTKAPQPSKAEKTIITHEEEGAALVLFLTGGFTIWVTFR